MMSNGSFFPYQYSSTINQGSSSRFRHAIQREKAAFPVGRVFRKPEDRSLRANWIILILLLHSTTCRALGIRYFTYSF